MEEKKQEAPAKGERKPTDEELREEFRRTLETPLDEKDVDAAAKESLACDIRIAELDLASARLRSQIAANEAEAAQCRIAKAIIARRMANKRD